MRGMKTLYLTVLSRVLTFICIKVSYRCPLKSKVTQENLELNCGDERFAWKLST